MSSEELVLEKILSTGTNGIKKSDLKKEFTAFDLDKTLENLVNDGKVCIDKKGSAYYCWTSEVYLKHLNNVDPKFRILIERMKFIERKLDIHSNSVKDALNGLIDLLKTEELLERPTGGARKDIFWAAATAVIIGVTAAPVEPGKQQP